jgi:hypothetical protein
VRQLRMGFLLAGLISASTVCGQQAASAAQALRQTSFMRNPASSLTWADFG